jgi:DNA repair exonuclease SbcCD nuclease subunit
MTAFRFVHTADLHLDSPFLGIQEVDEHVAGELREATFRTFDRIVELCLKRHADFLLVAGDIYDSRDRSLRAQLRFRDGLRSLSEAGISSFIVHGNHDPLDSWAATLEWPEGVHAFGGKSVTAKPVERNAKGFQRTEDGPFAIGLLHCNVGDDTGHEPYAPCTLGDLAKAGMDYWALGHVHNHRVLSGTEPMIVYPGNPQGRNPRELGARGCYFVDVDETGHPTAQFVAVDMVRWLWESIAIEQLDTDEELVSAVEQACLRMREDAEGRSVVGRISLTGRGRAYASLARPGFVTGLLESIRETEGADDPFVWIERLKVDTRPSIDLEARRAGQDFVADLLKLTESHRKDPERIQSLSPRLEPLFLGRGQRYLENPTDEDVARWLDAAEAMCADLLTAEES